MRTISAALLALTLLGCGHTLVVGQDGRIRVVVQGDRIVFDDPILFAMDSDEILHESDALLDEIAKTLQEHEEIAAVVAPKLMGGLAARTPLADLGFTGMVQVAGTV